ncbi:hypothetical protein DL770_009546 [Monosporascus sp. CRB-9-2]|nr:hypothetical protein DL770_009546 [Monosporascus sp. CRB-9-2]
MNVSLNVDVSLVDAHLLCRPIGTVYLIRLTLPALYELETSAMAPETQAAEIRTQTVTWEGQVFVTTWPLGNGPGTTETPATADTPPPAAQSWGNEAGRPELPIAFACSDTPADSDHACLGGNNSGSRRHRKRSPPSSGSRYSSSSVDSSRSSMSSQSMGNAESQTLSEPGPVNVSDPGSPNLNPTATPGPDVPPPVAGGGWGPPSGAPMGFPPAHDRPGPGPGPGPPPMPGRGGQIPMMGRGWPPLGRGGFPFGRGGPPPMGSS